MPRKRKEEQEAEQAPRFWWEGLPADETIPVILTLRVDTSDLKALSVPDRRAAVMTRNVQVVEKTLGFFRNNPDVFSTADLNTLHFLEGLQLALVGLTPRQCSEVMESGLVEEITKSERKPFFQNPDKVR